VKVLQSRRAIQWVMAAVVILIGIQFSLWVIPHLEGRWPSVSRPPGVEAFLPIDAMLGLRHLLNHGVVDAVHPAGLAIFIGICLMSLIVAKSFCSHICPIGLLSELLGRLGLRLTGKTVTPPKWLDLPLRGARDEFEASGGHGDLAQGHAEVDAALRAGRERSALEVRLEPIKQEETAGIRGPLLLLLGAAGVLSLIACAIVANLLLGEAIGRQREIRTRFALGASRLRITRLLLTESILLGLGLNDLSMNARTIPIIKKVIRALSLKQAREDFRNVIRLTTAKEVRNYILDRMRELLPELDEKGYY